MNKVKLLEEKKKEREIKVGDLFGYKDSFYMLVEIYSVSSDLSDYQKYQLIKLEKGESIGFWKSLEDFADYYEESDFIQVEEGESIQITPYLKG